jgi:AcrR family transcriptional regulator
VPDATAKKQAPERRGQARAQRTRRRILELASAAFARDGYEGTSLNEVIRESGLTKGAFYFHFSSKKELALAAFRFKQEHLVERLFAEADEQSDALTALRTLLRARVRLFRADPSLACVLRLGAELGAEAGPDSEFARYQELTIEAFADLVRRGQRERVVRADLGPRAAGEAIFAAMIGADRVSRLLSGRSDLERRTEELLDLLVNGLQERSER